MKMLVTGSNPAEIKNQLDKIYQSLYTENYEGINTAVNDINNILIKTTEIASVKCKKRHVCRKMSQRKSNIYEMKLGENFKGSAKNGQENK